MEAHQTFSPDMNEDGCNPIKPCCYSEMKRNYFHIVSSVTCICVSRNNFLDQMHQLYHDPGTMSSDIEGSHSRGGNGRWRYRTTTSELICPRLSRKKDGVISNHSTMYHMRGSKAKFWCTATSRVRFPLWAMCHVELHSELASVQAGCPHLV